MEGLLCGDDVQGVSCNMIPTVHELINMLASCRHNGFPCLADDGKIRGSFCATR